MRNAPMYHEDELSSVTKLSDLRAERRAQQLRKAGRFAALALVVLVSLSFGVYGAMRTTAAGRAHHSAGHR